MRIAVADDEPLVRSLVRSLILEVRPETVVLEASDGIELAALLAEGKADAAFVDIRMPKMDGFAALAAVREKGRKAPWFVLSSYSDFAYAKRAIELGALGYALKPPSPAEIRSALAQLSDSVAEDRSKAGDRFLRDLALYLMGNADEPPDLGASVRYSAAFVCLDGEIGREKREKRALAVARLIGERAKRYADEGLLVASVAWGASGDVAALAAFPAESASAEAAAKRFWNEAAPAAEAESSGAVRALVLVSGTECEASKTTLESLRELSLRRAALPGGALAAERARSLLSVVSPSELAAAERAAALVDCLRDGDSIGLNASLRDLFAAGAPPRSAAVLLDRYLGRGAAALPEPEFRAACEGALEGAADRGSDRDTISAVEAFIRRRYAERVSVEETARVFGLTPNYLSALFHKRVGTTFVQYVTEVRLFKARDALREGRSVKETAREVGYGSERHFTRLYRERFGHAPAFEKKNTAKS